MSDKQLVVTENWLMALLPSGWEVLAQGVWIACATASVTQLVICVVLSVPLMPKFLFATALSAAIGLAAWLGLFSRRMRVLQRERETVAQLHPAGEPE